MIDDRLARQVQIEESAWAAQEVDGMLDEYRDLTRRLAEALRMVEEIPQPKDWTIDRWSAFKARRRIALAEARAAGVIE